LGLSTPELGNHRGDRGKLRHDNAMCRRRRGVERSAGVANRGSAPTARWSREWQAWPV